MKNLPQSMCLPQNGRVPYTESGFVGNDVFRGFSCIGADWGLEARKFRVRLAAGAFSHVGWWVSIPPSLPSKTNRGFRGAASILRKAPALCCAAVLGAWWMIAQGFEVGPCPATLTTAQDGAGMVCGCRWCREHGATTAILTRKLKRNFGCAAVSEKQFWHAALNPLAACGSFRNISAVAHSTLSHGMRRKF